jgi:DNA-binding MarR family transcriptional regulator
MAPKRKAARQGPAQPRAGTWPESSPLADAHGPIVHTIFRISRKNRAMVGALLRPLGLFAGQELLLMQLDERAARPQSELIAALGIDHSTVSKMLQRMEAAGLVARGASAADRRAGVVRLTAAGRRLRRAIERIWQEMEQLTVAHLRAGERTALLALLRSVEARLKPEGG